MEQLRSSVEQRAQSWNYIFRQGHLILIFITIFPALFRHISSYLLLFPIMACSIFSYFLAFPALIPHISWYFLVFLNIY